MENPSGCVKCGSGTGMCTPHFDEFWKEFQQKSRRDDMIGLLRLVLSRHDHHESFAWCELLERAIVVLGELESKPQ